MGHNFMSSEHVARLEDSMNAKRMADRRMRVELVEPIRFRPTFRDKLILRVIGFFAWVRDCYNPPRIERR